MGIYNKIIINNEVMIDLSNDTVIENKLIEGITAHNAEGLQITGNIKKYNGEYEGDIEVLKATMYSYNGTVLPALPEWDKTQYPYAVIIGDSNGSFGTFPTRLFLSTVPLLYTTSALYWCLLYGSADGSCIGYEWETINDEGTITYIPGFVRDESLDKTFSAGGVAGDKMVVNNILWANYDVYKHPSGTELALATCNDPVPIYE